MMSNQQFVLLENEGVIHVQGEKAQTFLQGQLTCDVTKVTKDHSILTACCNPKGRMVSLFRVFMWNNEYYFSIAKELIELTIKHLKKFAMFSKVDLIDASDQFVTLGLLNNEQLSDTNAKMLSITNHQVLLIVPQSDASIIAAISKHCEEVSEIEWRRMNIVNKYPRLIASLSEQLLPSDLDLTESDSVSFEKGCYQGQEIIARMYYRNVKKQGLLSQTLETDQALEPGMELLTKEQQHAGYILDAIQENIQKWQALMTIKNDHAEDFSFSS